ncbi:Uncharacterised protein [uncultured archaeon]|nr:Uncharacterised protein [uncultured archaeon]
MKPTNETKESSAKFTCFRNRELNMTNFKNPQDFFGSYIGYYDGRNAKLVIGDVKADSPWPMFHLTFTDLDRNEVYVGTHQHRGNQGHVLTDIKLNKKGGGGAVNWSRLHLHTWDIAHLSGVSLWNGIEFGMYFKRF